MAGKSSEKKEKITISFVGTKKFNQKLVDRIYELLMSEDFLEGYARPGCSLTFNSTIEPSEEV